MTRRQDFRVGITCDDNSCTMRYYIDGEPLAVGIIRATYYRNSSMFNRLVVQLSSMDVNGVLEYLHSKGGLTTEEAVDIVVDMKKDAIRQITEYLSTDEDGEEPKDSFRQAASD